jgi:hypothetical protein
MRNFSQQVALVPLAAAVTYLVTLLWVVSSLPAPSEAPSASPLPHWWLWVAALGGLLVAHVAVVLPVLALARRLSSRVLRLALPCLPAVIGTIGVAIGLASPSYPWYSGWPIGFGIALAGVPLAISSGFAIRQARWERESLARAA